MSKTVAAIIPNYNYADFIIERIDSVLEQTYPVSELIILDDASPDDSVKIIKQKIKEIKQNYPQIRVRLIVNEKNSGGLVFSQWQKGLKEITSDYFWIAEADDTADKHFLETAMQKFAEYPSAVLFYSDSYRIDQNGKILSKTCSDWADMWGKGRWNEDFFNKGEDEVINYLGETNPILNVSSVVWKNQKNLMKIFEEAKKFKVAGDWYIYTRVLESGDIVYSAQPLNRYRKHNQGSASTIVKLSREYSEVVEIQERVAKKYHLSKENLEWQKFRRKGMGMVENTQNKGTKGKIAWFVPDFDKGSGGHRTIFQNINMLIENGYTCDLYVNTMGRKMPVEVYNNICNWYMDFKGDVFSDFYPAKKYDMVIATGWDTAEPVSRITCEKKLYFVQDYEPWFFSMGQEYIGAVESYKYGLRNVTIGHWLPAKLKEEFGQKAAAFSFGADLEVYKRRKDVKKENAICFIYQPGKPRRCSDLGLRALKIVQKVRPDVKIYLYGSEKLKTKDKNVEHLGVLNVEECNELYNKCKVGLCFSASNPSRIPFEMMAAGLPVVDLYLQNNLYDFPENGCMLAEPKAEAIAAALLKILEDEKLQQKLSKGGEKFMRDYPLQKGFDEFLDIINNTMQGKRVKNADCVRTYNREPVEAGERELKLVSDERIAFRGVESVSGQKILLSQLLIRNGVCLVKMIIPQRAYNGLKRMLGR